MLNFVNENDKEANAFKRCGRNRSSAYPYCIDYAENKSAIDSLSQISLHPSECSSKDGSLGNYRISNEQDNDDSASD